MEVLLNLFDDIPDNVGFNKEGTHGRRQYGRGDIPKILECIEIQKKIEMRRTGTTPEEMLWYDLTVYGFLNKYVGMKLTWKLAKNPEIRYFKFVEPVGEPEMISE